MVQQNSKDLLRKFGAFGRWLSNAIMPRGLFPRALIIIIAPVFLLQTIVGFVFMERHWQQVTAKLSRAVTQDIAAIVELLEKYPNEQDQRFILQMASQTLNLQVSFLPAEALPDQKSGGFFDLVEDELGRQITKRLNRPVWIDARHKQNIIEVRIDQGKRIMSVLARQEHVYASNSHIFIVWMLGSSLVLLFIAIVFLRNQITPILRLSRQMESFGKGRGVSSDFSPRGASEVRMASHQFLTMKNRLERQMEQRTTMLAGVSHDLRTVLTRFRLQLALLGQKVDVQPLEDDVDQMQDMLKGYLDFVSGHGEEPAKPINIFNVISVFENEAELRNIRFKLDCDPKIIANVRPIAISRLFENLFSNAFRFSDLVEVSVSQTKRKGIAYLSFQIDDNGPGIEEKDRGEALKPFTRLDSARNLDQHGTGLGLTIANDIVLTHGGSLTLGDSPSGGLRVLIELPH